MFEGIGRFEGRSSLRTWVYRILINIARKRGSAEQRTVPWTSLVPDHVPTVDPQRFRGADDQYPGGGWRFPSFGRRPRARSWPTSSD